MIYILIAIVAAYLIGAIPTAYIFGKALKGIDIREHGSGNVGATNVARTVGKVPGLIVFVIDFLKGMVAVTVIPAILQSFLPDLRGSYSFAYILLGAAAIAGHIWTCFLKFRGGKGVATTAGVMAGLSPGIFFGCMGIWIIVFAIWKYVSLASIVTSIALPVFAVLAAKKMDFIIFCAVLCLVGVYVHRSNIKRLIQGTESKIVKAKKS
jgi:glycerol-3-phosphate acyltransferase PlsY